MNRVPKTVNKLPVVKKPRAEYEEMLAFQLRTLGVKEAFAKHRGIPGRRFEFDVVIPSKRIAVEINGGNWVGGRHSRAKSLQNEYEKLTLATIHGWKIMLYTPEQVKDWSAARQVQEFSISL